MVRRRIGILRFWIDKTPSMSSCLSRQSRKRNQQMSTIQLFVIILPLWKKMEQEFEVMEYMEEEENLGMSLDFLDML